MLPIRRHALRLTIYRWRGMSAAYFRRCLRHYLLPLPQRALRRLLLMLMLRVICFDADTMRHAI